MKDRRKNSKRTAALVALIGTLLFTCSAGILSACNNESVLPPEDPPAVTLGEATYYYDGEGKEYLISLLEGGYFTFNVRDFAGYGGYAFSDGELDFRFEQAGAPDVKATYSDGAITLIYDDAQMRFLERVEYTLSFVSGGGSDVASQKVINGKTAKAPAEPTREGFTFVGWYEDDTFTAPYLFGATPVTGDKTLYAQWVQTRPGQEEFTVDFSLGFEGDAPAPVTTRGGQVFDLPAPERENYRFAGWYYSDFDDEARLTALCTKEHVFHENTTLFALWTQSAGTKLATPEVSVTATSVSWGSVAGVSRYDVEITGPEGFNAVQTSVGTTNYAVDFASAPAGEYTVRVTAKSSVSSNDSETAVRGYNNKALARVSLFSVVEPATLVYNKVEGAEKYYVSVVCANPLHAHDNYDNGTSLHFNFPNCEIPEGGIRFRVTAVAAGRASSVSREFVYDRPLGAVEGFYLDEEETLHWSPVKNATGYTVSVECGDGEHVHAESVDTPSYSLKECTPKAGGIKVSVQAASRGYHAPAPSVYTFEKKTLPAPRNVKLDGYTLSWDEVEGVTSYDVRIGSRTFTASRPTLDITNLLSWTPETDYAITVRAAGTASSPWSDPLEVRYLALYPTLIYRGGVLSWRPVVGAQAYDVQINDALPARTTATSMSVTLPAAGVNTLAVRWFNGTVASQWVKIEVTAHTITLDTLSGSALSPVYAATGDYVTLPSPTRDGYDFGGWYSAPGGPESMAAEFEENSEYTSFGDLVLYAYWIPKSYHVTYYLDEERGEQGGKDVVYSRPFTLDIPEEQSETSRFAGWFTEPYGGGTKLTAEDGVGLFPWNITEDVTVYAYWADVLSYRYLENSATYSVSQGPGINLVTTVTVPQTYMGKTVSTVEGYAFRNARNLRVLNIPNTVDVVETATAFYNCPRLEAVNVYEAGDRDPAYTSESGVLILLNSPTGDKEISYYPVARAEAFRIPDFVTSIPARVFAGTPVTEVYIPKSVSRIYTDAFYYCTLLVKVTFEEVSITEGPSPLQLYSGAFRNCISLATITLPSRAMFDTGSDVPATFANVFAGCSSLASIHIQQDRLNNLMSASNDGVITDSAGTTVVFCPQGKGGTYTIPAGITKIGDRAFADCRSLAGIEIPSYVSTIGKEAFTGCSDLLTVTFTGGGGSTARTAVGERAFAECGAVNVIFEEESHVVSLGSEAFMDCASLAAIEFPGTLESIGNYAFQGCTSLAKVSFAESKGVRLTISGSIFAGAIFTEILIPNHVNVASTVSLKTLFDGCDLLENVYIQGDNQNYGSYSRDGKPDGVIYNKNLDEIVYFPTGKTEYKLPNSISRISADTFKNSLGLKRIEIGYNVLSVAAEAFYRLPKLEEVIFTNPPEGEAEQPLVLGERAFADCVNLHTVVFPDRLTSLPKQVLASLSAEGGGSYPYPSSLQSVTLPAKLETIGESAFENSAIEHITFPETVTEIAKYAFRNSALKEVTLPPRLTTLRNESFAGTQISSLNIPATVTGSESEPFSNCPNLEHLTFEYGVTFVGQFKNCPKLKEVTLPETIEEIRYEAFAGSGITTITVPGSVTSLNNGAFKGCSELREVIFAKGDKPLEIGNATTGSSSGVFSGLTELVSVTIPSRTTTLCAGAFYGCKKLKTVIFEQGCSITNIYSQTFEDCSSLTGIELPASVTAIGERAFAGSSAETGLTRLTEITLPEGLVTLGKGAFRYSGLTAINLPATLTTLGGGAFMGTALASATFAPASILKTIGSSDAYGAEGGVFAQTPLTQIKIPASVTEIRDYTFDGCASLSSVEFEESTEGLVFGGSYGVFRGCTSLTSFTVPGRTASIGISTFEGLSALTSVTFEEGTADLTIAKSAFSGTGIGEITLPARLTTLGADAFALSGLTSVTFSTGVKLREIPAGAFRGTAITSFEVPASVERIAFDYSTTSTTHTAFEDCSALASITVETGNENYAADGGVLFNAANTTLYLCPAAKTGDYTIPENVTTVSPLAFRGNSLTNLTIASTVTSIGAYAFAESASLEHADFKDGTTLLSLSAEGLFYNDAALTSVSMKRINTISSAHLFDGCSNLASLTLPSTLTRVTGSYTFANTSRLTEVNFENAADVVDFSASYAFYQSGLLSFSFPEHAATIGANAFDGSSLASFTAAEGLTRIEEYAFQGTPLVSVTIPASVTEIGKYAFADTSSLSEVTFAKDGEEKPLSLGERAFLRSAVETIQLPARTSSWGSSIFESASSLSGFTFEDGFGLKSLPQYGFRNSGIQTLVVPDTVTNFNSALEGCSALTAITLPAGYTTYSFSAYTLFHGCTALHDVYVSDGSEQFSDIGGVLFDKAGTALVYYPVGREGDYHIPQGTLTIESSAFSSHAGLTAVYIPASVTKIDTSAFNADAALKKVVFEEGAGEELTIANGSISYSSSTGQYSTAGGVFANCKLLDTVTFSARVTQIGAAAFFGDTALTAVTLPEQLTVVGRGAFAFSGLAAIEIPKDVEELGSMAFYGCETLSDITFEEGGSADLVIGGSSGETGYTFANCPSLETFTLSRRAYDIKDHAFDSDAALSEFTVESNGRLTAIGNYTFRGCTSLREIVLPDTVSEIGVSAFAGTSLQSAVLSPSLAVIGDYAFDGTFLSALELPASVTTIGVAAFRNIPVEGSLTVPDNVTSIGASAFENCYGLTEINLPYGLEEIGASAFAACTGVEYIYIPDTVTSIGEGSFAGIRAIELASRNTSFVTDDEGVLLSGDLTTILAFPAAATGRYEVPERITKLGAGAFAACNLSEIVLHEGITEIPDSAFKGAQKLTSVTIRGNITRIGSNAFRDTPMLTVSFTFGEGLRTVGEYAFAGSAVTAVHFPSTVSSFGEGTFKDSAVEEVTLPEGNTAATTLSMAMFMNSGIREITIPAQVRSLYQDCFNGCVSLSSVTFLPHAENYFSISVNAFRGCKELKEITLPEEKKSFTLGGYAFAESGLEEITLPAGISTVDEGTFKDCTELLRVTLPEGVTTVGISAFEGCAQLTEVSLPETLKWLNEGAFRNCTELVSLTLPASLLAIRDYAFEGCTSLSLDVPASVTELGCGVFKGFAAPQKVTLPGKRDELPEDWDENFGEGCEEGVLSFAE